MKAVAWRNFIAQGDNLRDHPPRGGVKPIAEFRVLKHKSKMATSALGTMLALTNDGNTAILFGGISSVRFLARLLTSAGPEVGHGAVFAPLIS